MQASPGDALRHHHWKKLNKTFAENLECGEWRVLFDMSALNKSKEQEQASGERI
jgi:hypothetical protein